MKPHWKTAMGRETTYLHRVTGTDSHYFAKSLGTSQEANEDLQAVADLLNKISQLEEINRDLMGALSTARTLLIEATDTGDMRAPWDDCAESHAKYCEEILSRANPSPNPPKPRQRPPSAITTPMKPTPQIGQTVYLLYIGNNSPRRGVEPQLIPATVVKIGQKYFSVKREGIPYHDQFHLDTRIEKGDFPGWKAYTSPQDWEDEKEASHAVRRIWKAFEYGNNPGIPLEKLREIIAILDLYSPTKPEAQP